MALFFLFQLACRQRTAHWNWCFLALRRATQLACCLHVAFLALALNVNSENSPVRHALELFEFFVIAAIN